MKRPLVSKERLRYERGLLRELRAHGLPDALTGQVKATLRRGRIPHGADVDLATMATLRQGEREGYGMLLTALREGRLIL